MRFAILLALFTLGAAPLPITSEVLECRLPYPDAAAALNRLRALSHKDLPGEDEYRHTRKLDPAHLTAFGYPVRALNTEKVDAISHQSLTIETVLDAPFVAVRSAALASRVKNACADSVGPPGDCEIEEREQDGWTTDFRLEAQGERAVLTCIYLGPAT